MRFWCAIRNSSHDKPLHQPRRSSREEIEVRPIVAGPDFVTCSSHSTSTGRHSVRTGRNRGPSPVCLCRMGIVMAPPNPPPLARTLQGGSHSSTHPTAETAACRRGGPAPPGPPPSSDIRASRLPGCRSVRMPSGDVVGCDASRSASASSGRPAARQASVPPASTRTRAPVAAASSVAASRAITPSGDVST